MATQKQETRDQAYDLYYAIGDRADTLRRRRRMTQKQLGMTIGITESAMSYKLSGQNPWTAYEVATVARALAVTIGVLYGDEPMPEPTRPARITRIDTSKNADELGASNAPRPVAYPAFGARPAPHKKAS